MDTSSFATKLEGAEKTKPPRPLIQGNCDMAWCDGLEVRGGGQRKKPAGPGGVDGALVSKQRPRRDLGLARPGASPADAAADWMRGTTTDQTKPPLCPSATASLAPSPSSSPIFSSFSISPVSIKLRFPNYDSPDSLCQGVLVADTHKKQRAPHGVRK